MADYEEGGADDAMDDLGEDLFSGLAEDDGAVPPDAAVELPGIKPELRKLYTQHPELIVDYIETVTPLLTDPKNHTTYPFLTTYEKAAVIGLRANQLSQGIRPFVAVPRHITDVRQIARLELEQKKIPFIIKRPLPNGTYEYWRLNDLMLIH
jgi:DNA-directed RNA polymerase subunit K/omega